MSKLFIVNIGYQTTAPRGAVDIYGINSELFVGNGGDQAAYLGNTVRLNLGNIMLSKNLAGVAASDNYKHIETSTGTGYAAIELRYAGNIAFYGANGATSAGTQIASPICRLWVQGSNGNIGIGTTAPSAMLHVVGNALITAGLNVNNQIIANVANGAANGDAINLGQLNTALSFKVSGSGTVGRIAKFGTASSVADSGIWDTGVNIGIGTTAPTRKLEVIGTCYISGGLDVGSQKITNVAAGTASTDAVNVSQLSGVGSKWTLTGTDIYRLSNVIIGNNYALQMYNTSNVAQAVLKLNTANHIELSTPNDLYLLSGGTVRLKVWGASNGAISVGQQPTGIQHALQVGNDSSGNLWTFRAIFNSQKNNNFQVGDSSATFFSIHNLSSNAVDIGNKAVSVATNVLYTMETANEVRHRFDGNQFGDNNIGNRIMKRMAACINCAALQTQATCSIAFNTSAASSSNHRFVVEIEGSITGTYFKYTAVIFYANSAATVTAVTALNSITNCNAPTVSVVSNQVVLAIGKSTGNFTYSNLIITTQATGYVNGIDQAAPAVSNITFA